ncbi:MAG TPA: phosphodiester glycosidase family protein, partial [Acidimicrobiia bacterium]
MRRLGFVLIVLLMAAPASGAAPNVPAGFSVISRSPLRASVEYLTLSRSGSSPAFAHVAHIPPGAPVDLRVVSSHDRITRATDDRELTSSMCARVGCVVGVNGDFWDYQDTKQPLGGVVSGRRMLRSPQPGHPQVTLTGDGRLQAGDLQWSAQAVGGGAALAVNGVNRPAPAGGVVLFTPAWGDATEAGPGVELVLQVAGPLGTLNREVTAEAVGLRSPGGSLPAGGAVLAGTGTGEDAVRQLWTRLAASDRRLSLTVSSPGDVVESIGSHPVLLQGGQKVFPAATDDFTVKGYHRTVLGWNGAGDVFMVAVDDDTSDSKGMSLADAADFLLGLGATDAVNFDGGGGTTFVVDGAMVNRPRTDDGDIERPAGNAFLAVPRAAGPPGGDPNPAPAPGPGPNPCKCPPNRSGYWMVGSDGAVYAFGDARYLGNALVSGGAQAVDLEPTASGNGYWIVDDNGSVFAFGDARYLGNADRSRLVAGEKVTSLSATPTGSGYWFFTSKGRVLTRGDAGLFGDVAAIKLNGPVLDSIPTPSGRGYYMVGADGGIFAFGDAVFHGSTGNIRLNDPVQSLVPDPDGVGYWLVASDGGVFSFEGAFRGSLGG